MNLTEDQLHILRHMLGIDDPYMAKPEPTRNYYCASSGDVKLIALADAGAVEFYSLHCGYEWYQCTDIGKAAGISSHKKIRHSKGKRMYRRYINLRDTWPDLTFRQFLTDPNLRDIRSQA